MNDLTGFQRHLLCVISPLKEPLASQPRKSSSTTPNRKSTTVDRIRIWTRWSTGASSKRVKDRRTNEYRITDRGRREIDARPKWEHQYVVSVGEAV